MAKDQTMTEELAAIEIYTGACGVLNLLLGVMLVACSIAAFIVCPQIFHLPITFVGLFIAGFPVGLWTLFSGVCYSVLSYKGKGNANQLYLRMVGFMIHWMIFALILQVAAIPILSVSVTWSPETRVVTIPALVGCVVSFLLTLVGSLKLAYRPIELLGLEFKRPRKENVLAAFKSHGFGLVFMGVHQIVWALIALIVPEFGGRDHNVRIAAFSIGGFIVPVLGFLGAIVCWKIVKNVNNLTENQRVMTKIMIKEYKTWSAVLGTSLVITSIGLYGGCFKSLADDYGNLTTAPFFIVVGHILSLVGSVLIAYMMGAVVHFQRYEEVLGLGTPLKSARTAPEQTSSTNSMREASNANFYSQSAREQRW